VSAPAALLVMPARPSGFSKLPVRCLSCGKRFRFESVKLHGGALRCEGCQGVQYCLPLPNTPLVFLCAMTAQEVNALAARGVDAFDVLEHLGLTVRIP
jgi:hypothetical protein